MGVSTIKKITFIGAGSYIFARNLIKDILTFPAFEDANIVLMDIDEDRLNISKNAIECIIDKGNYSAKLNATTNRAEALGGADGVLSAVTVGSYELYYAGVDLPMNYGVDYSVGDTRGIPGIFAYLRTIPTMLDICRDIEKYCPDAIFLNYTNPMSMICRTLQSETKAKVIGLCHSVQNTAEMLAQWIDADIADITYTCAGINHQAWYLEYKYRGKDAYPLILKAIEDGDVYNKDIVRNEMFKHLGYYVTESSKHNSEYNPWFRKRPDLIQKYVPITSIILSHSDFFRH
jgi:alpha-galactosidase